MTRLVCTSFILRDDLLGSVRSVTTSSPITTVYSSNYKPYGNSYGQTQFLPAVFDYYYTHKPFDSTTGLYYYGARFYDPGINRFITEDSSEYSTITNPITLNQYVYALNNPETNDDPSGHMIDMWSSGSTNMEPPAAPPAKPPVVTVPPQTPQSGEGSYRFGNMVGNTNHNNYAASTEKFTIPQPHQLSTTSGSPNQGTFTVDFLKAHIFELASILTDVGATIFGLVALKFMPSVLKPIEDAVAIMAAGQLWDIDQVVIDPDSFNAIMLFAKTAAKIVAASIKEVLNDWWIAAALALAGIGGVAIDVTGVGAAADFALGATMTSADIGVMLVEYNQEWSSYQKTGVMP